MEALQISLNINIDFSENTKAFIAGLFSQKVAPISSTTTEKVVTTTTKAPVTSTTTKPVATTTKAPTTSSTTTEKVVTAEEESEYTDADVRKIMAIKLDDFRAEIKDKLTGLGVKNVSTMDPKDYAGFVEFLNSL